MEGEEVTKSKDCDLVDTQTTNQMLETFEKRPLKRYIFDDFEKMDDRQKNYTRTMYEYVLQQQQQQQIYSSYNYNKINPTQMSNVSQMNQM